MSKEPFSLLESPHWRDYELLDSGDGLKLERFGAYVFARPEVQAMWSRALPRKEWDAAEPERCARREEEKQKYRDQILQFHLTGKFA